MLLLGFTEFDFLLLVFTEFYLLLLGIYRVLLAFTGFFPSSSCFQRVFTEFLIRTGFHWISTSSNGFHRVFRAFQPVASGPYRVLPGFTEFLADSFHFQLRFIAMDRFICEQSATQSFVGPSAVLAAVVVVVVEPRAGREFRAAEKWVR